MNEQVFHLLLDRPMTGSEPEMASVNPWNNESRSGKQNGGKARPEGMGRAERAEWRVLAAHKDKAPAVSQRIRVLAQRMAQPSRWRLLTLRFSRKAKQNLAELEALVQYGCSRAVWEIAYLERRKAVEKLTPMEQAELETLILYHDCPSVLAITRLKVKERFGRLDEAEARELNTLQRNLYRDGGIPQQVLDLFRARPGGLDFRVGAR